MRLFGWLVGRLFVCVCAWDLCLFGGLDGCSFVRLFDVLNVLRFSLVVVSPWCGVCHWMWLVAPCCCIALFGIVCCCVLLRVVALYGFRCALLFGKVRGCLLLFVACCVMVLVCLLRVACWLVVVVCCVS